MNSSLVHILNNVKNKNTELFIEKINKLNTTNPTEEDYQCLTRKKSKIELVLLVILEKEDYFCFRI
jgi:hypothetical protein